MEELDLLKKDWKRNENAFDQVSEKDIYLMLHRKSSSIVKWILIISILELLLWTIISLLGNADEYLNRIQNDSIVFCFRAFNYFHYGVIICLIYLFYRNYQRISTTASTRELMKNILQTRKTVQFYVWYNLAMMAISLVLGFIANIMYNPEIHDLVEKSNGNSQFMIGIFIGLTLSVLVIVGLFWLLYRVLYGVLLRKLLANYKELKKIDL